MKFDVEATMKRVHEEVSRRHGPVAAHLQIAGAAWRGELMQLPFKEAYDLADLLTYSDTSFVHNAYQAVLRRAPDSDGLTHYLERLRAGQLSKVEVLGELRWSAEGLARSVHIDGLLVPYKLHGWRRKRIIGPVIGWLHAFARLPQLAVRPSLMEGALAHEITVLGAHSSGLLNQLEAEQQAQSQAAQARIDDLQGGISQLLARFADLEGRVAHVSGQLVAMSEGVQVRIDDQQSQINDMHHHVTAHGARLAEAEHTREVELAAQSALNPMYVAFEQQFRGAPELIKERSRPYLGFIREAQVGSPDQPIVDLGSGNGEWLDLLREHGFSARGVDGNVLFVDLCRGRGLDVVHSDVLVYLKELPDGSVGAITGIHIVEHLPFGILVSVLDECRRVLCRGGLIALETPNPENLQVGSCTFYLDPTHRNPIPPEALRWIVQARGFQSATIHRWTIARDVTPAPILGDEVPGSSTLNEIMSQFHAAPDYAVIARRL